MVCRVGLYNINNNCCFLLRTCHNTTKSDLLTKSQFGFLPDDSCISKLLSITYKTYKWFDCNPPLDVKGTLLVSYKAFDKVLHKRLIFKLQTYVINGKLLNLMLEYLCSQQQVVLNGQTPSWVKFWQM